MFTNKELSWISTFEKMTNDDIMKQIEEDQAKVHNIELMIFAKKMYLITKSKQIEIDNYKGQIEKEEENNSSSPLLS